MRKLEASTSQAEITRLYDVWKKLIKKEDRIMKIKSKSDVITNSSNEIFIP